MTKAPAVRLLLVAVLALGVLSVPGPGAARAAGLPLPRAALAALAALAVTGNAVALAVSCPSSSYCAAGGYNTDGSSHNQASAASERNGRWGKASVLPGSVALNVGGNAQVLSVSCAAAGDCSAGGYYTDAATHEQAFVASERNGRWGKAIEVPGSAALNPHAKAWVYSVSCPSSGNCAAGGYYTDRSFDIQAFVVNERNGRWGTILEVPGSAALNAGSDGAALSASCSSAGNCAVGGEFSDRAARFQAFVDTEQGGRWGKAIKVPGTATLNAGGAASANAVSCPLAGNCAATGYYTDHAFRNQAFVVTERNGRWGKAIMVPGTAGLNLGGNAQAFSVSCPASGTCAVGGYYTDGAHRLQAFVAGERNGRWRTAFEVPGLAGLNAGGNAQVLTVSCPAPGTCAVGGYYTDRAQHIQAFVASERNGRWRSAFEVPGLAGLNVAGNAQAFSASCPSAGNCVVGGYYTGRSARAHAFAVTERGGHWSNAVTVP